MANYNFDKMQKIKSFKKINYSITVILTLLLLSVSACRENDRNTAPELEVPNSNHSGVLAFNEFSYDATQSGTTFIDANGDTLVYTIEGLPDGLTDSGDGSLIGTPISTGTFSVIIFAHDSKGGIANDEFELTIEMGTVGITVVGNIIKESDENGKQIEINLVNSHFIDSATYDNSTVQVEKLPKGLNYNVNRINNSQLIVTIINDSTENYDLDITTSDFYIKSTLLKNIDFDISADGITFKASLDRDGDGLSDVDELYVFGTNYQVANQPLNITVAEHRYNASSSMSINTDQSYPHSLWMAEYFAFKHNIGITVFDYVISGAGQASNRKEADITGRLSWELYLKTDFWFEPDSSTRQLIPDYYATKWTVAGASKFSNAVVGSSKNSRYPNHGQQLFDISGGLYGFDNQWNVHGLIDVHTKMIESQVSDFSDLFGYRTSAVAYRNGRTGISDALLPYFISGRNSISSINSDSDIDYSNSITHKQAISRESSTRWLTPGGFVGGGDSEATEYCIGEINRALGNSGFWNNFTHFHRLNTEILKESWQNFMEQIESTIGDNLVYWDGYGEINQYLFLRKSLESVTAFQDGEDVVIVIDMNNVSDDLKLESFRIPLSFTLNLRDSELTREDLGTGEAISVRKEETDVFNVEIMPIKLKGLTVTRLSGTPAYLNLERPNIRAVEEINGRVEVTTDQPTRLTFFHVNRGGEEYSTSVLYRSNSLQSTHVIDFNIDSVRNYQSKNSLEEILLGDVYIGVITDSGQSRISEAYQWQ